MSLFSRLLNAFRSNAISDAEARAEAWALGGRHRGEVVQGARTELTAAELTPARARLLHAVIRRETALRVAGSPLREPA